MNLAADGFDWDDGNRAKCGKHGVTVDQIEALFDAVVLVAPDPKHSGEEARFIAIGRNEEGRPMFVAFTFRDQGGLRLVRPVSARYMPAKEVASYEARS
jgi:hypothetical protein